MAIKHVNSGLFIDTDPVDPPEGQDEPAEGHIYAYAIFRSLEHVSYGLTLKESPEGDEIDSIEVGEYGMEPLASFWEYADALDAIRRSGGKTHVFEDEPFVEVESMEDYSEAIFELSGGKEEATGDDLENWQGPGLYDFRDNLPSYQGTVEENELEELERAADEAFDFMFQGDEWKESYAELAGSEED